MTKKDLIKIIREVVKREVQSSVKREMNEVLNEMESSKKTSIKNTANKETTFTSNTTLNDILNENLVIDNDDFSLVSYIEGRRKRLIANNLIIGSSFQISNNYDNRYDKRNFKQWKLKLKSSGNLASLFSKKNDPMCPRHPVINIFIVISNFNIIINNKIYKSN